MFHIYVIAEGHAPQTIAHVTDERDAHTVFNAEVVSNAEESLYTVTIFLADAHGLIIREETITLD